MTMSDNKKTPNEKTELPKTKDVPRHKDPKRTTGRYSQRRLEPIEPGMPRPSQPTLTADQLDECIDCD